MAVSLSANSAGIRPVKRRKAEKTENWLARIVRSSGRHDGIPERQKFEAGKAAAMARDEILDEPQHHIERVQPDVRSELMPRRARGRLPDEHWKFSGNSLLCTRVFNLRRLRPKKAVHDALRTLTECLAAYICVFLAAPLWAGTFEKFARSCFLGCSVSFLLCWLQLQAKRPYIGLHMQFCFLLLVERRSLKERR